MKSKSSLCAAVAAVSVALCARAAEESRFAAGGDVSFVDNGFEVVHAFRTAGAHTFTLSAPQTVWFLLVGGGGAGGTDCGGGGGGGGFVESNAVSLAAGTYTVTVGAGGAPSSARGGNGGASSIVLDGDEPREIARAAGGGGGGGWSNGVGASGASGGGATRGKAGGSGIAPFGFAGGSCTNNFERPSGGGGAGGAGASSTGNRNGGAVSGGGGPGRASAITGAEVYYAGGGGGGGFYATAGLYGDCGRGGIGGGGNGAENNSVAVRKNYSYVGGGTWYEAEAGVNGLGGGGGGGNNSDYTGRPGGCGCVIIRLANVASSCAAPVPFFIAQTNARLTGATFEASLLSPGDGHAGEGVSLTIQYSTDAGAFDGGSFTGREMALSPSFSGAQTLTLSGLLPESTYTARLKATNAGGETGFSGVFTLTTLSPEGEKFVTGADSTATPGLWQIMHSGLGLDWAFDATSEGRVVMPGTIAAALGNDSRLDGYWGRNGNEYQAADGTIWTLPSNYSYGYVGYMLMRAGDTYNFFEKFEDQFRLAIDGNNVLRDTSFQNASSASYVCTASGWHSVKLWFSGSGGGRGCRAGWRFAFGYNKNGAPAILVANGKPTNLGDFEMLLNKDDDVFLWTAIPARFVEIASASPDSANDALALSIQLASVTADLAPSELWAAWRATSGGTDTNLWDHCARLNADTTYDATAQTVSATIRGLAGMRHVRVFAKGADGSLGWSDIVDVDVSTPMLSGIHVEHDGDVAAVSFNIDGLGAGGVSTAIQHGTNETFEACGTVPVPQATEIGTFTNAIVTVPGVANYVRVVVRDAAGAEGFSSVVSFVPRATSLLRSDTSASASHRTVTFGGGFDVLGAGVTTLSLFTGESAEAMEPDGAPVAFSTLSFSTQRTYPGERRTLYYKFVSVNTAPGGTTWTNETATKTVTTRDNVVYTWKADVADGYWKDRANWTPNTSASNCTGYPDDPDQVGGSTALFPGSGLTATIRLTGTCRAQRTRLYGRNHNVTFLGEGEGVTLRADLILGRNADNSNSKWTFSNVAIVEYDIIDEGFGASGRNVELVFTNGTTTSMPLPPELVNAPNSRFAVVDGSRATFTGGNALAITAATSRVDVVSSVVSASSGIRFNASGTNGGIELRIGGVDPQVICGNGVFANVNGKAVENDVGVAFDIPEGGWNAAALYSSSTTGTLAAFSGDGNTGKLAISIDPKSRVFRVARKRRVPLVAWRGGIATNDLALVDANGVRYAYTYGWPSTREAPANEGDAPTGLSAEIQGRGALVFMVQ